MELLAQVMEGLAVPLAGAALIAAIAVMTLAFRRNSRLLDDSHREALTDTLTRLGNRRKLLEDLEDAIADARDGHSWLLIALDLDGFKAFNDSHGHPAGDALLARLGCGLEVAVGGRGAAYRLGGDEFCALVRDRDRGVVTAAISDALSQSGQGVSASHGIVSVPAEAGDPKRALELADQRMYADKARRDIGAPQVNEALAEALEQRRGTSGLSELARRVAQALGLSGEDLELVVRAADLHDVGKAAMPDALLNTAEAPDATGRALLEHQAAVGERILSAARPLGPVARLVRAADERWDGNGCPDRLSGEQIPLGARIVSACRGYQELTAGPAGMSREVALEELQRESGMRFDPGVIEALAKVSGPVETGPRRVAGTGLAAALALATMLLLPTSALATTVSLDQGKLTVTAAPGQANDIRVYTVIDDDDDDGRSGALVTDEAPGATLSPGAGCISWKDGDVACSLPSSIEVRGGDRNDALTAYTWMPVKLVGGTGNDTLRGGSGNDTLEGNEGHDTLYGQAGDDHINSRDGGADTVSCGSGQDSVTGDSADGVGSDCETTVLAAPVQFPSPSKTPVPQLIIPPTLRMGFDGFVRVRVRCPQSVARRCRGMVRLASFAGSKRASTAGVLGRRRYSVRAGRTTVVKVRMSRRGRRRVLRRRRLRCRASATLRRGATVRRVVTVRAPR